MDLEKYLLRRGGAAKRGDLFRAGFRRAALEAAVDSGRLYRPLRGVYALNGADDCVLAAFRANGRLTCVSAARFYGLWALRTPQEVHLSCGNGVPKAGVVDHGPCRHAPDSGYPVAGLADVLLHAVKCLPEFEALTLVQSATGRGQITADFLRGKLVGNRNGRARGVLDLLIPRADSVLEILAHTHFVRAGLTVRMHVPLPGVGEVDCLVEECLVVELDGSTHFEPRQVKKDHRRNNAGMRGGFLTLRFYYDDVVYRPEAMVEEVLLVLRLRTLGTFAPD
ncbi:MAG TPA: type IV toxin-antitoxin system AbiEi family antitoxin domain-containing protein [Arthrobacter sp.]|jgi:very-short-patch-repair endonuclease|uniref:type IV toxin-antitoxin system AbiEi family antitoxin domain-containing protein n=1 Tax=Arthrobacter sp. TaxID=1667 RepID=UPI002F3E8B93